MAYGLAAGKLRNETHLRRAVALPLQAVQIAALLGPMLFVKEIEVVDGEDAPRSPAGTERGELMDGVPHVKARQQPRHIAVNRPRRQIVHPRAEGTHILRRHQQGDPLLAAQPVGVTPIPAPIIQRYLPQPAMGMTQNAEVYQNVHIRAEKGVSPRSPVGATTCRKGFPANGPSRSARRGSPASPSTASV